MRHKACVYSGTLNEPIVRRRGAGLLASPELESERIGGAICEKMVALLDHYKIDSASENCWEVLAISLALEHVPGFAVVDEIPRRGRPKKWRYFEAADLVRTIDTINSERGRGIQDATAIAVKRDPARWGKNSKSLQARYYEAKRRMALIDSSAPHFGALSSWAAAPPGGWAALPPGGLLAPLGGVAAVPCEDSQVPTILAPKISV